jgi:hypothetical protein
MSSGERERAADDGGTVSRVTRRLVPRVAWAPFLDFFARSKSRAESAAVRWRASAALSAADGVPRAARTTRTDAPSTRTPAMKMSARCSLFVGIVHEDAIARPTQCNPFRASRIDLLHLSEGWRRARSQQSCPVMHPCFRAHG